MRNTIKTIAALLIVLSAATANAKTDSASVASFCKVVAQNSEDSYKLIYKGAEKGDVTVRWKDVKGQTIYTENYQSADSFVKQYDLSTLPDGKYVVTLEADDYSFTKEVVLGDMSDFKFILKGTASKNVVLTGYQPQGKDVTVVILDDRDNLIYKEALKDTEMVQKKYNFEKMATEKVKFMLYHNDKIFKEESIVF